MPSFPFPRGRGSQNGIEPHGYDCEPEPTTQIRYCPFQMGPVNAPIRAATVPAAGFSAPAVLQCARLDGLSDQLVGCRLRWLRHVSRRTDRPALFLVVYPLVCLRRPL